MLDALIEKEDPDGPYGRIGSRYGPFSIHDSIFSPASPSQGPFLELLESAAAEGLRLIRAAVEHATQWRREQYIEARQALPRMSIPFPSGTKAFEGDWLVYHWSRSVAPSATTVSALMALEAWGHRQIEAGKPFEDVLHDVLGPDGSSLAFVSVAVDLALSHWQEACDAVWPMAATPELLELDDARMLRDLAGVDRMASFEQEPSMWRVKRADLEARPSRRNRLSDKIGHYVFHGKPKQLEMLRAALEQARNEIKQRPSVGEDPINGLTATAKRALRMTEAQHWPLVKVRLRDGSETEARQFQRDPEEQRLMEEKASRAEANLRHQNVRLKIQTALLDRSKSTVEVVMEGIEWAKAVSVTAEPAPPEDDEDKNYNKEWDRRAVVMAAALAARDYEGPDRSEIVGWALPILNTAIVEKGREYPGNDQIEYNRTVIAGLGFLALYLRDRSVCHRDTLLRLSAYQHLSVLSALGRNFPNLIQADARLPRSIIRVIMAASIHPRRAFSDGENRANQQAYAERVDAGITAERNWLDGQGDEPDWPELPPLQPRWRQRIRLPGGTEEGHEVAEEEWPNQIVDEHALGAIPNYLIRLTIGELPPWIVTLAERLMHWTDQANGPHGERDCDRDNRPYTWNSHFFDFLGILCVALPHNEVVAKFVEPITRFRDDAFHDAMASFLRGFDRAMQAIDTKKPENAVGIRELLAERIRKSWNYKRFGREKTMNSETHAGDALNAVFYQSYRLVAHGRPSLPDNWDGLDATMPTLLRLVTGAPTSGWIAISFLNLIDTSPRASLLPSVTEAIKAWCTAYGVDANFWSEKEFGPRVCAWLLRTLEADPPPATILATVEADLLKCLDVLIRSGVAQARQVEERITEVQVAEN
jgi:hypothetical protein